MRTFEVEVWWQGSMLKRVQKQATDHRSAVMLVVSEFSLTPRHECVVNEVIRLPKSTYRIFEHTSMEIEQKC